jgi:hypothetical protein
MVAVSGFTPSSRGLRFPNRWPKAAAFTIKVLGRDVEVGNAQRGLCGGMVFAVRDYFEYSLPVPNVTEAPASGVLYQYIGRRLKESFDLPLGPTKYLDFMAAPAGDKGIPLWKWIFGPSVRGIAWRTIHDELPKIIADIDSDHVSCIGLVCASGINPASLGENHQVLAYRYEQLGEEIHLWVYDPNRAMQDDVYLKFSMANPGRPTPIEFVNGSKDVRGFFRVAYASSQPPAL